MAALGHGTGDDGGGGGGEGELEEPVDPVSCRGRTGHVRYAREMHVRCRGDAGGEVRRRGRKEGQGARSGDPKRGRSEGQEGRGQEGRGQRVKVRAV